MRDEPTDKDDDKNVGIPAPVYKDMRAWCRKNRAVMKDVVGDILRNFLDSEEVVQKVFLKGVTRGMERDYARALDALAKGVRTVPIKGDTAGGRPPWEPDPANPPPKLPVVFTDEREGAGPNETERPAQTGPTVQQTAKAGMESIDPVQEPRRERARRGRSAKKRQPSGR